jgi:phosphoribosylanthranilate isomerase
VNADFLYLAKIIENFSPDFVQFHGDENMEFLKKFKEKYPEIGVIKAIRINEEKDLLEADKFEQIADYLMFDSKIKTKNEGEFGGTGHGFNWKILDKLNLKKPWFLSGGIKISNLDEALKTKAFALDISSGIEKIKGEKSDEMIVELMKNLKMKRLEMKDLEK